VVARETDEADVAFHGTATLRLRGSLRPVTSL
jgi:hypothetical protein